MFSERFLNDPQPCPPLQTSFPVTPSPSTTTAPHFKHLSLLPPPHLPPLPRLQTSFPVTPLHPPPLPPTSSIFPCYPLPICHPCLPLQISFPVTPSPSTTPAPCNKRFDRTSRVFTFPSVLDDMRQEVTLSYFSFKTKRTGG